VSFLIFDILFNLKIKYWVNLKTYGFRKTKTWKKKEGS